LSGAPILVGVAMSYDSACLELAQAFLSDESKALQARAGELAQVIQDVIEEWIEENSQPPETA